MGSSRPWQVGAFALLCTLACVANGRTVADGMVRTNTDPKEMQVHMELPEQFEGNIMGKGGERIGQTAKETGCQVWVTKPSPFGRRVAMLGENKKCAAAQKSIHNQLVEASKAAGQKLGDWVSVWLWLRLETLGAVMGKGAAGLSEIQKKAGVNVNILRDDIEGHRPCNIRGPLSKVLQAEALINEQVQKVAEKITTKPVTSTRGKGTKLKMTAMEGVTKLLVPNEMAGKVIGKEGKGLRHVWAVSGAKVDMEKQAAWPSDRVVTLTGPEVSRAKAVETLMEIAFRDAWPSAILKILVPSELVGSIIGKEGKVMAAIRQQCGVKVTVEQEDVGGERLVSAKSSSQASLDAAAAQILTRVDRLIAKQAEEASGGAKTPASPSKPAGGMNSPMGKKGGKRKAAALVGLLAGSEAAAPEDMQEEAAAQAKVAKKEEEAEEEEAEEEEAEEDSQLRLRGGGAAPVAAGMGQEAVELGERGQDSIVSLPTAALMGLFAGSGATFAIFHLHRGASTAGEQPLLAN